MDNSYTKINILTVQKLQIRIQEYLVLLLILLITHWLPLDQPNEFFMPLLPRRKKIWLEKDYLLRTLRAIEQGK